MKTIHDYLRIVEGEIHEELSVQDRRVFNTLSKKQDKDPDSLSREEMERLYALKRRAKHFAAPDKRKKS